MKYQPFAIWLLALIVGILLQIKFDFSFNFVLISTAVSGLLLIISFFFNTHFKGFYSLMGILILMNLGAWRCEQQNAYINNLPNYVELDEIVHFKIKHKLKPSEKYLKYIAQPIAAENNNRKQEKILVYIKKNQPELLVDDTFWTYGLVQTIFGPQNPHQFDYKRYMGLKGVGLQIFCDTIVGISHPHGFAPNHSISKFKTNIKHKLIENNFSKDAQVFISALALGDRTDLGAEYQEKLSSAGVLHLFAISGLHVGIIFGLFMVLLYPVLFIKNGRYLRYIIALSLIWLYAWFVGFTPSVTRAAFMLTIYFLTLMMQRPTNIFHTLAVTAFVILLINPNQLFNVGFQLSYSAVFFIAWLFPVIRKFFPRYRKPYKNIPFDLLSVTTSAQIGVMPVSVFYFNKFSGLFLLGNIVLLPFASVLVVVSLISIVLLHFDAMPLFLITVLNFLFQVIFAFIDWLISFDSLIFRDISWSWLQVGILLVLLIWIKDVLKAFKLYKLIPILLLFLLFQLTVIVDKYKFENKKEFIVFQEYKGSVIGLREGTNLHVFMQVADAGKTMHYTIKPYVLHEKIKNVKVSGLNDDFRSSYFTKDGNLIKFNGETYGIVQGKIDSIPSMDYVILRKGHAKTQFPTSVKKVIADGSNYPNVIESIAQDSVNIYATARDGAYVVQLISD